ncbi:uncharacterized protein LOC116346993 [Contarinia nasturtii]|uniref:uncharacterized protein LOC116346993 n=1 Tax=Contarinia nasturtii TaxID=265458 RepID=UPI0012D3ABC6|nr:uncharacterized protein LOC116346993 [Contarinia nasturtii]
MSTRIQTRSKKGPLVDVVNEIKPKKSGKKHKTEHSSILSKKQKIRHDAPDAKDSNEVNGSDSSTTNDAQSTSINNMYNALEQVLKMKYLNVIERLKLSFPAKCTRSLENCNEQHYRNDYIPKSDNISTSQTFLQNHQPLMFIHAVQMDIVQTKFPGRNILHSLFELILGISDSSNEEYEVTNVIDMAAFTIGCIFDKFPPCWLAANMEYRNFITTTKKNLIVDSHELLNNRTLFADIIQGLENVIQAKSKVTVSALDDQFGDSFNDSLVLNFRQWESKHAHKFLFDNQKRDDKIERLFVVLALYVQLFEADLAMWTIKNRLNPSEKLATNRKNPLIEVVMWTNNEPNEVNYTIKNILKLYVNYIYIDFPREHTKIIGRLVNLIYNVFELRALQASKTSIEYPTPIQNQSKFCDSFTKIIFEIIGCSVNNWLKIIQMVEHPRLKLYLVTALLTKIDHKCSTLHPETIYYSLRKIETFIGDDFDDKYQNNNVVKPKNSKVSACNASTLKYPCLQKFSRRTVEELSIRQNAELHLIALNSYKSVFHIDEFRRYWENYEQMKQQNTKDQDEIKMEMVSCAKTPPKPFNFKQMESMRRKSFGGRVLEMGKVTPIYTLDVLNDVAGITDGINFQLNVRRYRDDLKFVDMIATDMPKLRSKFDTLFPTLN